MILHDFTMVSSFQNISNKFQSNDGLSGIPGHCGHNHWLTFLTPCQLISHKEMFK